MPWCSPWIIHDEFEGNREGRGLQPCRLARPEFRFQPLREGAGVIRLDLQRCPVLTTSGAKARVFIGSGRHG